MRRSAISWCDFSGGDLNVVTGCSPVSAGCENCYARAIFTRFGRDFSKVCIHPEKVEKLLRAPWPQDGNVRGPHSKPLLFLCNTGDLFHPDVPADFIIHAFEMMAFRRDVDWVVLTKRPERMVEVLFSAEGNYYLGGGDYCPNIILGVTAENQEMADQRIPILMKNWMGLKLVSVEPMLGPVELPGLCSVGKKPPSSADCASCDDDPDGCDTCHSIGQCDSCCDSQWCDGHFAHHLSWVICGGESGPKRRPFRKEWAKALYRECRAAQVPMFFKQGSALRPGQDDRIEGYQIHEWPR